MAGEYDALLRAPAEQPSPPNEYDALLGDQPGPASEYDALLEPDKKQGDGIVHRMMNDVREFGAAAGRYIFHGLEGISDNEAKNLAHPTLPSMVAIKSGDTAAIQESLTPAPSAQIDKAKQTAAYWHQRADQANAESNVDPNLADQFDSRIARAIGGATPMVMEGMIPLAGVPMMAMHGAAATEAEAHNAGKSETEAGDAAARSMIGLSIFGGTNKAAALGVAKLLPAGAATVTKFLGQFVGQEAANEMSSRAIGAWEAAIGAKPGDKVPAAMKALSETHLETSVLNAMYAGMGAAGEAGAPEKTLNAQRSTSNAEVAQSDPVWTSGIPWMTRIRVQDQLKARGIDPEQVAKMTQAEVDQALAPAVSQSELPPETAAATTPEIVAEPTPVRVERPITPEEQALREYQQEVLQSADEGQANQGAELIDAIAGAGGLPSRNSPAREAWAGELASLDEAVRDPMRKETIAPNKLFRQTAPDLDRLAISLRDQGFDVQTPDDVIQLVDQRLRTGKPIYGTPARETALATTQQATLPRNISTPAPIRTARGDKLISEADIRNYLSSALDIPVRMGTRVKGGVTGALGLFRPKPETIRMKALNDIPTLAHETGHYLHHLLLVDPATGKPSAFAQQFDHELRPLGKVTSRPSYTWDQVRLEGVAEHFREWLTDRSVALAHAPDFTTFFEKTLKGKYPQTWEIVNNAREQLGKFIAQPGWEKARSRIVFDGKQPRATFREWLSKKYANWFNELAPIEHTLRRLTEFGLDPATAQQVADRAINYKGGWRGKADFDLEFEQTNIDGKRAGPGLKQILKGLDPNELGDFSTYIALKRAEEKATQGIKTGFEGELTEPETRKKLNDLAPRFEAKRQQLIQYSDNALKLLHDSGFFTGEQMTAIRKANQDYVPFYRVYEGMKGAGAGPRGTGQTGGFVNTNSGVLRMKGSDRQIIDPLESIIKNTYAFRDLAERNRVGREFVNAVTATQGGGRIGESVLKPMKPTKIGHDDMVEHLKTLGLDDNDINSLGPDIGMTLWRAADGVRPKDGTFRIWDNGKEKLFQVDDADLLRSLSLADSIDASVVKLFPLFKPFAAITRMLRVGATLTPEFIVRNPFRDQITAGVFSRYGFVPFFDGFRGMLSVLRKDNYYKDWIKSGGRYSGLYDVESATMRGALEKVIQDPNALEEAWGWVRHPLRTLAEMSSLIEEATRVAEFRKAERAGADPTVAANAAKDVTLNFSRSGLKGKIVNQLMAFFNAGLQDIDKMVRAHREAPVRTVTKALMYITAPSILAWAAGKDDELIQNLPEWRKSFFWNVNLGGRVFSLPKPFLLGSIYGTSVEKALDYANGRDPNAVWKALSAIYQSGSPARGDMITATNAFKPLVENMTNYSFFKGQKLVNESQAGLSPALQFSPSTSETAKFAGKVAGMSPIYIDNLIRGYFGGLGKYATDAVDWVMLKAQGNDTPAAPAKDISQYPLIRGFMKQPYEASQYVQRFYNALGIAETRQKDLGAYGNQLDTEGMRGFLQKNRDALVWYNAAAGDKTVMTALRGVRDDLGDINKAMVAVQQSRSIGAEDKSRRLIKLGQMRDKLAEAAFKIYVHTDDRSKAF